MTVIVGMSAGTFRIAWGGGTVPKEGKLGTDVEIPAILSGIREGLVTMISNAKRVAENSGTLLERCAK